MFYTNIALVILLTVVESMDAFEPVASCRSKSSNLRQDGGLCFEVPPWEHLPVDLENHLERSKQKFNKLMLFTRRQLKEQRPALVNSEVSRYMDTVLGPFLDTYHRNIQNAYQQLTGKILKRIKDEINLGIQKKQQIYNELSMLADSLNVPAMCDEERRATKTLASRHMAQLYECTEEARASIAKMGKYAEEMISITQNYMQRTLDDAARMMDGSEGNNIKKINSTTCLKELAKAAVTLGYELDLSLTNARRHNEQSCTKFTACTTRFKKQSEDNVTALREQLYQCVFA